MTKDFKADEKLVHESLEYLIVTEKPDVYE